MTPKSWPERRALVLRLMLVGVCVAAWPWIAGQAWTDLVARGDRVPSWLAGDIDTALIRDGLLHAPRWIDTLRWWTGPWVGQVPFYRPLTSYLFWFEWRAFGDREPLYVLPTLVGHAAAGVVFAVLVGQMALRYRVPRPSAAEIIAALAFAGFFVEYRRNVVTAVATQWKNQPDSLAAACVFAALLCYLQARRGSRLALAAAAALYLAACCFKEIAIPLPLVCAALEVESFRRLPGRRALGRVVGMAGAGAFFLGVRWLAIGGLGYTYGSNRAWVRRTAEEALAPFGPTLHSGAWLGLALAGWLWIVAACGWALHARRKSRADQSRAIPPSGLAGGMIALLTLGASLLGGLYQLTTDQPEYSFGSPLLWVSGLMICFDPVALFPAATAACFIAVLVTLARARAAALGVAATWTVGFLLPLTVSPGPLHRYYLPQAGHWLAFSLAAAVWLSYLDTRLGRRWRGLPAGSAPGDVASDRPGGLGNSHGQ
jgi:hypothetical protein